MQSTITHNQYLNFAKHYGLHLVLSIFIKNNNSTYSLNPTFLGMFEEDLSNTLPAFPKKRLTKNEVANIRLDSRKPKVIAQQYKISVSTVSRIKANITWKEVPAHIAIGREGTIDDTRVFAWELRATKLENNEKKSWEEVYGQQIEAGIASGKYQSQSTKSE